MKKLLCLLIVCALFACSDSKEPTHQTEKVGRFQLSSGPYPFVIDTKEGHVWRISSGPTFELIDFDKKHQSALEAVRAYSSLSKAEVHSSPPKVENALTPKPGKKLTAEDILGPRPDNK